MYYCTFLIPTFNTYFWLHNNHLDFCACPHNFELLLCTKKGLNILLYKYKSPLITQFFFFQHKADVNIYYTSEILNAAHLTHIFRQHNIHFIFSTYQHRYKLILCTGKLVLNASFQDFWCRNIHNHLIPYTQHEFLALNTYLSSASKKSDAKIYILQPFLPKW